MGRAGGLRQQGACAQSSLLFSESSRPQQEQGRVSPPLCGRRQYERSQVPQLQEVDSGPSVTHRGSSALRAPPALSLPPGRAEPSMHKDGGPCGRLLL